MTELLQYLQDHPVIFLINCLTIIGAAPALFVFVKFTTKFVKASIEYGIVNPWKVFNKVCRSHARLIYSGGNVNYPMLLFFLTSCMYFGLIAITLMVCAVFSGNLVLFSMTMNLPVPNPETTTFLLYASLANIVMFSLATLYSIFLLIDLSVMKAQDA